MNELTMRRGLLLIAAATALTGVLAGLARLGVAVGFGPAHALEHGPLMVLGVFGAVIGLERAVALARGWAFAAPVAGAVAAVAMLSGLSWAPWAAWASSVALVAVNVAVVRKQAAHFTWLMLTGSVVLALGNLAWALGHSVFEVVPAWIAFFVLTIVAERLELSRLAPTPRWASRALVIVALVFAVSAGASTRSFGVSMVLMAAWQLRFDLARRTVRIPGLPRFSAVGVMLGAVWLLVSGVLLAINVLPPAGPLYDAVLHTVFVGYVLSMVFAHAPIILPAVARVNIHFHPVLWTAPVVLHLGLLARVLGDLTGDFALRKAGSIANALALALFAVSAVSAQLLHRKRGVLPELGRHEPRAAGRSM